MYENFFSLNARPFDLTPSPRFFFASRQHRQAFTSLRSGLSQGEGFVVITGAPGLGKSMLAQTVISTLANGQCTVGHIVFAKLDGHELLRMVAVALNLPATEMSESELLTRIKSFLHDAARRDRRVLLVVDEAHNLAPAALRSLCMLADYQIDGKPCLQCFLIGQEAFQDTLNHPEMADLRRRVVAVHHLEPLTDQEVRDYILHRLQCAGWKQSPSFDSRAFPMISAFTGGVPRRINTLCDRLLLNAFLENSCRVTPAAVTQITDDLCNELAVIRPEAGVAPAALPYKLSPPSVDPPRAFDRGTLHAELTIECATPTDEQGPTVERELTRDASDVDEELRQLDQTSGEHRDKHRLRLVPLSLLLAIVGSLMPHNVAVDAVPGHVTAAWQRLIARLSPEETVADPGPLEPQANVAPPERFRLSQARPLHKPDQRKP